MMLGRVVAVIHPYIIFIKLFICSFSPDSGQHLRWLHFATAKMPRSRGCVWSEEWVVKKITGMTAPGHGRTIRHAQTSNNFFTGTVDSMGESTKTYENSELVQSTGMIERQLRDLKGSYINPCIWEQAVELNAEESWWPRTELYFS